MMIKFSRFCFVLAALLLLSCGDIEESNEPNEHSPNNNRVQAAPDKFITFVNTQASLPAGFYHAAIDAESSIPSFSYELTIQQNDVSETLTGSWQGVGASLHALQLNKAGGVKLTLSAPEGARLSIVKGEDFVFAPQTVTNDSNVNIDLPQSKISNEAYSNAYYEAVDPEGLRTTLEGYQKINGFDQGDATHIVFRDSKDLGYGRSMFARQREDGSIAFYVDNYVIKLNGSSPANYSPLNVHAAVDQNQDFLISTNAIEFSPIDTNDPNSPKVAKFFTYGKPDENGMQHRLLSADLDGRGEKPVPTTCISCHGGALLPLNESGEFPAQSLYTTKLNLLELDSFEYSDKPGFSQAEQNAALNYVNQLIYETYQQQDTISDVKGLWSADFALEVANSHYNGTFEVNDYDPKAVPAGWQQNGSRPAGVEELYREVVRPHCISCHSLRGTEIGEATQVNHNGQQVSLANAVNFSNYEKFISYSDRIIDYVYKRGQMPLSLRNYEKFWRHPQGKPALLASFLPNFDVLTEDNKVSEPSHPYAKISAPAELVAPTMIIGEHSLFAETYLWEVIDRPSANATFEVETWDSPNLAIVSATPGDYSLGLTVTNKAGVESNQTTIQVTISEEVTIPTFDSEVREILGSASNTNCSQCHRADSDYPNIPAYFNDANTNAFDEVRARIDFADPQNSPLLIKPTSLQHGGGIHLNRSTPAGEAQYQTLLSWIHAGAPCGTDPQFCD